MNRHLFWKTSASVIALSAATFLFGTAAFAHGSTKPKHGGVVQMAGETLFELTVRPDSVALYVTDDDEEVASSGMVAKLTIAYKGAKSEVTLEPAAGNKFEGKGVKVVSGSKVGVLLTNKATQAKVSANFVIE